MRSRGLFALLGVLIGAGGLFGALRYQKDLAAELYVRRLEAADVAPDDHVKAALALRAAAAPPKKAPLDRLSEPAKLRYVLATGASLKEQFRAMAPPPETPYNPHDATADADRLTAALAAEMQLQRLLMELVPKNQEVCERFLGASTDPVVRRRAANALEPSGDLRALPALRGALADPDLSVRLAALQAGNSIARRTGDMTVRIAFLTDAARVSSIARKALDQEDLVADPRVIPVLLAYMDRSDANDFERGQATQAILRIAGPERSTPTGVDPAAWRAWWASDAAAPLRK